MIEDGSVSQNTPRGCVRITKYTYFDYTYKVIVISPTGRNSSDFLSTYCDHLSFDLGLHRIWTWNRNHLACMSHDNHSGLFYFKIVPKILVL